MIAIPLHRSRVAPVLDWCSTILLIPKTTGKSWHDGEQLTVDTNVFDLLRLLRRKNVSPVICGALSPHALCFGRHLGLEFICGVSGAIDEVVEAYRAGELDEPRFRLPGCRCTGYHRPPPGVGRADHASEMEGISMSGNQGRGGPIRRQQGRGRNRACAGRGAGNTMTGAVCVCPQCGMEAPHIRGVPCSRSVCRECGAPLIRKSPSPGPPR